MNFTSSFLEALATPPHVTSDLNTNILYETVYDLNMTTADNLITILARSTVTAGYPFSYDISGLDCYCFIYTYSGNGKLETKAKDQTLLLNPSTLTFFDCNTPFTLETLAAPWKFRILFVYGGNLPFYMEATESSFGCTLENRLPGDFLPHLNAIFEGSSECHLINKLEDEKNLIGLCTSFIGKYLEKDSERVYIPHYLQEMKHLFDSHYEECYSLDDLESRLGINKYRLCREFSSHFNQSPIQYLNHVRISNSKLLLQNTNLKIHEIGTKVGIENTNHFINLFKRQEGTTPLLYRETRLSH